MGSGHQLSAVSFPLRLAVVSRFGIGEAAATLDITLYRELVPKISITTPRLDPM